MTTARQMLIIVMKQIKPLHAIGNILKASSEAKFAFSNPNYPPIIIYQMGKVGSSTVHKSLMCASVSNPIFHLHFLSQDITKHRQTHKKAGISPSPYNFYLGEAIRKQFDKNQGFPVKIISLVRDPIAFIISDLFQNPNFAGESILNDRGSIEPKKASKYIDHKLRDPNAFTYIYEWFDRELKAVFDIDVFATPFPSETGYAVYSKTNVEAMVIRLEDLSEKGPKAIADFLSLDAPLVLKQSNIRTNSKENKVYRQVRESVSLTYSVVEKIYSSKFVKHFYNETLINEFILNWTKSSSNLSTELQ